MLRHMRLNHGPPSHALIGVDMRFANQRMESTDVDSGVNEHIKSEDEDDKTLNM